MHDSSSSSDSSSGSSFDIAPTSQPTTQPTADPTTAFPQATPAADTAGNTPPPFGVGTTPTASTGDSIDYATPKTPQHEGPYEVPPEHRVPIKERVALGLGGVGGSVQIRADDFVLTPIFVLTYGISPAVMSTCALVYRAWDACTDFAMGYISDKTKSRWGRRKPYIFLGSILMSFAMPFLFFFDRSWPVTYIIIWMIALQLTIFLFHSIWNIPYQCLLLESTPDSVERTNVAAWRGYVGNIANLGMGWIWYATQLPIFHVNGQVDVLYGTRWLFTGLAVVVLILGFMPLFVKERTVVSTGKKPLTELTLWQNVKLTLTNRPFLILVLFTLLMTVGTTILWSLQLYTTLNYVFKGDTKFAALIGGYSQNIQFILGMLGIPLFQWIARRKGKPFAVMIIMACGALSALSTLVCYNPNYPYMVLLPGILMAPGNAGIWMLIPSMTGDAVDYDELTTYRRREGSFQATYSWTFKVSGSIATAISGPMLLWAGYDSSLKGALQPDNVVFNLRMIIAFAPAIIMAAAIIMILQYPLTPKKIAEVQATLAARRKADAEEQPA